MRHMFSLMLAFVLVFVCSVSVQAGSYSGHKKEIKQTVCSLPVMAVDQINADYLTTVSDANYIDCSARCINPDRTCIILEYKATGCIRTSRADSISSANVAMYRKSLAKLAKPFRLYNPLC